MFNIDEQLLQLLGSQDLVAQWWSSPNKYFGGDTPQQVWDTNPQRVIEYISKFCSGDYS